jgi:hypothetical protein
MRNHTRNLILGLLWAVAGLLATSTAQASYPLLTDKVTGRPACAVMAQALADEGWDANVIPTMVAISMAESNCRREAMNPAGEMSAGPLQVNVHKHPEFSAVRLTSANEAYHYSARAAKKIYERQGLTAWTVYKTGHYRRFMAQARTLVPIAMLASYSVKP